MVKVQSLPVNSEIAELYKSYVSDMESICSHHETGEDSRVIVREITEITDSLVLSLLLEHLMRLLQQDELPKHILLMAQGGYGRRHQHPKSDLDLIFLHKNPLSIAEQGLIAEFFRTLFDIGFVVGHCCRSYKEALVSSQDSHSQTAMSESRFLAGDWRLFERFKRELWRSIQKNRWERIRLKTEERQERLSQHGATINITEPNVKESQGGLRGFHYGLWIGSLMQGRTMNLLHLKRSHMIDDQKMDRVEKAVAFLWLLRNDLHFYTGKEQDILALPLQQEIARRLGYKDGAGRLAEEKMMRDYYTHALTISLFADQMGCLAVPKPFWSFLHVKKRKSLSGGFSLCDNKIYIPQDFDFFEHNPQRLLKAFILAAEESAKLSYQTATMIHDNLDLIDQAFLHDKHNAEMLRDFFSLDCNIEPALQQMRSIGFLERLFPEWKAISCLVRYDLVHRYTVDEHSLLCLYHLEHLLDDSMHFSEERFVLYRECEDRYLLRLAVLFHDIGKGRDGNHTKTGAILSEKIARRMRLSEKHSKRLTFLIKLHLLMSHTAQHLDLSDPMVAVDFSDAFDRVSDLDMMYLLTYVDMRSVAPHSMTEWKNNLLWQLYLASRDIFLSDSSSFDQHAHEMSRKEIVIETLSADFDNEIIVEHLDHLPPSYLLNLSRSNIRQHIEMVRDFDGQNPQIRFLPHLDPGCKQLDIVYRDSLGLFNRICTAIMLENFTIVEAKLYTRTDGIVANNITVRDLLVDQTIPESRLELLQDRVVRILNSDALSPLPPRFVKSDNIGRSSFENTVKISNDSTARFTVIVVRCADRYGLLQDISSVFTSMQINIHFARIITEGNRVTDVLYVTDSEGEKITEVDIISSIHKDLVDKIEPADENGAR